MSLFEYLSVALSIVLGLGLTHVLSHTRAVLRPEARHPTHLAWTVVMVLLLLQAWWALWDLHTLEPWTQFAFYYVLLGPVLLYVAVTTLVPRGDDPPDSWQMHFLRVRKTFFTTVLLYIAWAVLMTWLLEDVSLFHPFRGPQAGAFVLLTVGVFVEDRRYQSVLPYLIIGTFLVLQVTFRLLPGAFELPS